MRVGSRMRMWYYRLSGGPGGVYNEILRKKHCKLGLRGIADLTSKGSVNHWYGKLNQRTTLSKSARSQRIRHFGAWVEIVWAAHNG